MADAQSAGWMLRRLEKAVELARKVGRPLTFFAAIGFLLILAIPTAQYLVSDNDPALVGAVPSILALALIVDIICVLLWAKAKLKQDPKAFQDE